ncbi:hypothetical protein KUTeg_015457 [Tegillarca granosa]|uniref:Vitellogenin domain-containing protein n=1 Tax=Tegillarca granosa TaxID=220873 RepID=A0ABQ9EQ68_TEGGR|nr:hypothetical protein KUTeg_015457 [Tegillarca granosa]
MGPTLFLILAVVVGTQAGPIDTLSRETQTCARTCTGTNKFNYEQDKTYEFEYISKTSTSMVGASEGQADLEVTATAHVEVISKCELVLRVDNVRLFDTDPESGAKRDSLQTRQFQRALEAHPLRFSFQDGEIEEVCPAPGEQTWVLNIKRGMLSMFQNSMDDFSRDQNVKEHDVTGSCDAEYTVGENGWYTRSIRKTKNLMGCTGRHGYNTAIQGTPYRVPSKIQSLPIVKSTHECQQVINKEGRLQGASCTESHIFRPFSRESSGAVTKNTQNLKFLRERNGVSSPPMVSSRAKLMFEHANDIANMERSRTDTESKLREICQSTSTDIRPDTPKLFSDLVYLMKSLDADLLKQVYQQVKSTTFCSENQSRLRKFFLDAIPMVGTSSSLRLLTELITSNEVNGIEADMWMTSLAFIQNPTKDMLKEIVPLLSQSKGMLSVGTLVHSYCRVVSCDNDNDVRNIISELESKIGYGCYVDDTNMKQIIIALRSIGNAGQAETATSTISSCLARNENPTEVVLAAIDAFRRLSCDADRSSILAIFNDKTKDSELRIGAYIALMECPSTSFLSRVKQTLETEEANQVGSFIWTHLTNLMETSVRHKQNIRAILEDDTLQREFDMDKRKFSRNYEGSFFLEKLNTGASLEGNLIWSSKSFIPRSAMANLTVDLFGQSINLFEIGGRIEGLEYFLESYFGPNGYFSEDDVKESTEQAIKGISNKKFKNIDTRFKSTMDEMKGNLYMRVFGNELRYNSFSGVKDLSNGNNFNFLDFLIKLSKNHDYSFTQNIMFLDSSMIIPTSSGFPLNLTVNGTATIDLKASGRMDLRKLGTSPRSVSINGVIKPSMMSVDAFVTKSGMKMVSTLHSSTALQGNIELANGRVFNAQLDIPRQKMEILNFKTSFFTVHHDMEREQQMITENRKTKTVCTGDKMAKITGLELCGEVQFPNASLKADAPYFPFTGPVSLALDMYKRDTHTSYQMEARIVNGVTQTQTFTRLRTKEEASMRLGFNTPGSTVDRAFAADFILRKEDKTLEMNMISPWKKATFTGKVQYDRNVKHLSGKFDVDGKTLYLMKSEIKRSRKGPSYIFTPVVEIRVPKTKSRLQTYITKKAIKYRPFLSVKTPVKELIAFGGSVEYRPSSSATVDLTLDKVVDKPVKIFGKNTGNAKRQRIQGKIDIRSPILTTKMQSNIAIRGGKALNIRTQMDYIIPKVIRDKVTLNAKINRAQTKTTTTIKGNTNVGFKLRPEYNFQIASSMSHNKKHSEGSMEITYGANKKDRTKRLFISTSVTPKLAWKSSNLKSDFQIQHPASGIDMHVRIGHKHDKKSVDSSIIFEYGNKKSISTSLRLKNKSKALTSITASLSLAYPGKEIVISNDLTENNKNDFTHEISIQTAKNIRSAMRTNLRRPSRTEYEVSTDIQVVGMKRVSLAGQLNIDPKNFLAQLEKGNERYVVRYVTQYTENEGLIFNGELQYPSRRITAEIEGRKKNPVYNGRIDIKWNADKNEKDRLQLNAKTMYEGMENIESSISLTYPTNTLTLNLKHVGGKKYVSHFDMKWDTSKVIVLDTTFGIKEAKNSKQVKGTLKMSSPFRGFRSVAIDSTTQVDSSRYTTNMNINWKPIRRISATVTMKKPIRWDALDASIIVKSPLKGLSKILA